MEKNRCKEQIQRMHIPENATNNYCSADHVMKMKNVEFDSDVSQELHLFCESGYTLLTGVY